MTTKTKTEKQHPCEVLRDYWTAEGERITKGQIIELGSDDALDLVEKGMVRRVK